MAVDYFLNIDGIEGESQDQTLKNQIELASFSWSEEQTGTFATGGGGGCGKVHMQNFEFVTRTNKSSPKLLLACAKGQHIPQATLTCRKAGGGQQEFYTITLKEVLVSSYKTESIPPQHGSTNNVNGGYDDGMPYDRVALNFGRIEVEYRPQKSDGSLDNPIKAGYDLKTNQPV